MTRQIIFRGRKIQVALDPHALPDGQIVQYEAVLHPGAVVILPMLDTDRVCLLQNQRVIVGATLWEAPAGTLEPGEAVESAAQRELAEETGYRAGRWRKLAEFFSSPGIMTERMHLFLAEDLVPGPMQLEKDEHLEPQVVPWSQAVAWALDGTIQDAKTLVAVLLWEKLRQVTP